MILRAPTQPVIKSPLNYMGGKYKLMESLRLYMPEEVGTFVELFTGGLNVSPNIRAKRYELNDNMYPLVDFYRWLQTTPQDQVLAEIEALVSKYGLSKTNQSGFDSLRKDYNLNKSSAYLFVLVCYSFNHQIRFNSKNEFNISFGKDRSSFNPSMRSSLLNLHKWINCSEVTFTSLDFRQVNLGHLGEGDYVYCDPPYLVSTASYNEGWTNKEESDLLDLLDTLNNKGVMFGLSNILDSDKGENTQLQSWSKKYRVISMVHNMYANSNYQKKYKAVSSEVFVVNYDEDN